MEINLDCGICARSWTYSDVDMPQAELITQNWEQQHVHTTEEIKHFHESMDSTYTDWVDPDE